MGVGLYRDDGLAVTDKTLKETENNNNEITAIFEKYGLRITIEVNKKSVSFLDVTFNLTDNTYSPYTKPNSTPLYVNKRNNHPASVIKNIPAGINLLFSSLASDQQLFDSALTLYQKALYESGFDYKLHYKPENTEKRNNRFFGISPL